MSFKKFLAILAIVAMIATNISFTNAAAGVDVRLNGLTTDEITEDTTIGNIAIQTSGIAAPTADEVVIDLGADLELTSPTATIVTANGQLVPAGVTAAIVGTEIQVTTTTDAIPAGELFITLTGVKTPVLAVAGVEEDITVGVETFTVTPTSETGTVNVTAVVEPTLTMAIYETSTTTPLTALALGTDGILATGVAGTNAGDFDVLTTTNSGLGMKVTITSTGLKDGSNVIGTIAGTEYTIASTTDNSGTPLTSQTVDTTTTGNVVLNAANNTQANARTNVVLDAVINAATPAGNYSDTLTVTATASF